MRRRTLLNLALGTPLAGCASGRIEEAVRAVDLRKVAVLAIKEFAPDSGGSFNTWVSTPTQAAAPAKASVPVPVTPGTLGIAIGLSLRASADATKSGSDKLINDALQPLQIQPAKILAAALQAAFAKRAMQAALVQDARASELVRSDWDFELLAADDDAFLDVQIHGAGYFPVKALGYSPMVYVYTQLVARAKGGTRLGKYAYESDYRNAGGDVRFTKTPADMNVSALAEISSRRERIKLGVQTQLETIAELIATDLDRAMKKLPAL
jgi:hypothetical protein